jgi:hypothetical protein
MPPSGWLRDMSDQLFRKLARSTSRDLERVMRSSSSPDPRALVGYEWRGYNTAIATVLIGNRKFIKVFVAGPRRIEGHNYFAVGTSLDEPWQRRRRDAKGSIVGRYGVIPTGGFTHGRYARAMLINYGAHAHQNWVLRSIRDYVVQPDASDPDVLLGKAYFRLGRVAIPAGYFVLARLKPFADDRDA